MRTRGHINVHTEYVKIEEEEKPESMAVTDIGEMATTSDNHKIGGFSMVANSTHSYDRGRCYYR